MPTSRLSLLAWTFALLAGIWGTAYFQIARDHDEELRDADIALALKAQIYAENTRATIKRLNELLLDLRADWTGDWKKFAETIKARQAYISDITFQIGVIDAQGLLSYSNLAPPTVRTDLSDREHFRVHKDGNEAHDRLFISRPVKGRVSGKWSIQFTRPIWQGDKFQGVIVASISPDVLSAVHTHLKLSEEGASSILRDTGEVMARYPRSEELVGKVVDWPYSDATAPLSGNFRFVARLDGIERVFGYHKVPEYGLTFFAAESIHPLLASHKKRRNTMLMYAGSISIILLGMLFALYRTQQARSSTLSRLRASEQQQHLLGQAIAQSNASVVITDIRGNIVFVNRAFERVTGYRLDEAIGKNPRILKSGLNSPELYRNLWSALTQGKPWQGELQNRKKDGELYWETATISPIMDESGKITHFIAVKDDISEKKRKEVELRHAKEDAEAANIAKSQFLATMSHEIRTPMNGILGMAQLLLIPNLSEVERNEFARTILNSGNTLQTLLNDILDLSKVEAGKLTLMHTIFDPLPMLDEIAALFIDPATRKGLRIDACWHGSHQHYWADPIRIRQMLSNLVSNAIKFTDSGSILVEATELSRQGNNACLRFRVTDTGIGIPTDKQSHLFQPFSQVDGSSKRRYAGTGLGLSIVRSLAELMHGDVGVDSETGKGSSFWFDIQVELAEAANEHTSPPSGESAEANRPAGTAMAAPIMLVEDNETNRSVVLAMLGKQGYPVRCYENGRLAVDALLNGERPGVILMDCQMPVMDGFEATRFIRQWEQERNQPPLQIIALTAGAFQEDRAHCLSVGMNDFLTKPVDINMLLAAIEKALAKT